MRIALAKSRARLGSRTTRGRSGAGSAVGRGVAVESPGFAVGSPAPGAGPSLSPPPAIRATTTTIAKMAAPTPPISHHGLPLPRGGEGGRAASAAGAFPTASAESCSY